MDLKKTKQNRAFGLKKNKKKKQTLRPPTIFRTILSPLSSAHIYNTLVWALSAALALLAGVRAAVAEHVPGPRRPRGAPRVGSGGAGPRPPLT